MPPERGAPDRRHDTSPGEGDPTTAASDVAGEHAGSIADIQRRLERRPRISLRLRIAVVFAICAVVVTGITAGSLVVLSRIQAKLHFLEAADQCAFEMQEARRYEKNFFLYGTTLSDALDHAYRADRLLVANWDDVVGVIGEREAGSWLGNLREYETLLEAIAYNARSGAGGDAERQAGEVEVRRFGGAILDQAGTMIAKERQAMNAMIRTAMVGAAAFLGFMGLLLVLLADQLARQVIRPIGRFIRYVERIAQGDLSPIRPVRRYRDEFSTLAIAINRMLDEITVRQEQLVQSRKMAAVGTLTSGIAHELNNPLNNISLTAETLLDDFDTLNDPRKRQLLGDIFTQVQRASATVRNLLDFTRKDAPVHATVVIGDIIHATLQLVGNELALANVRPRVEIPPGLPAVDGNPRSLQQVFLNLFLNAMQAMPEGGDLTVAACRQGDEVRIAVRDTGVGIPEEYHERVFEPFFTTKAAGEGTGLGLSVSYSVVRQHGGRIELKSEVGQGATFIVVLPAKAAGG